MPKSPLACRTAILMIALGGGLATAQPLPVVGPMPGTCTVVRNDYGGFSVTGASVFGNQIVSFQPDAAIQMGSLAGNAASAFQIDCDGVNIAAGNKLAIRSGAASQRAIIRNTDANATTIAGTLVAESGSGVIVIGLGPDLSPAGPPPFLELVNANGITVELNGLIDGAGGLVVSGLSGWTVGESVINRGTIDGAAHLEVRGRKIQGGGAFIGDEVVLSTLTVANNPVNGSFFLSNSLQLYPAASGHVGLTLHAYGTAPQVLNVKINGDGEVWMPSTWGVGTTAPPNNAVIPKGGTRAAGIPEPAYGGGSMIVQATGSLRVASGPTNDFVFPGAIVMKALGTLDLNGVIINQGWTISGQQFQGVFFESPSIVSPVGNIQVLTNNPNWINFSTQPKQHVRTWSLTGDGSGGAGYVVADAFAPHLNTYSATIQAAANGECWTCLINTAPVDMY